METAPAAREKLLERALTDDAEIALEDKVLDSRPDLQSWINGRLNDEDYAVARTNRLRKESDGAWRFRLRVGKHGREHELELAARFAADGRITRVSTVSSKELSPRQSEQVIRWVRDNVLVALALLAGIAYVLVRIPLVIFYSKLGTTPDEVGLGTQDVVRQSVLILGAIAIACIVCLLVQTVITYLFLGETQVARRLIELEDERVGVVASTILAIGYTASLLSPVLSFAGTWALAFGLGLVIAPVICRFLPGARVAREAVYDRTRRIRIFSFPALAPAFGFSVVAALAAGLVITALVTAQDVREGGSVTFPLLVWTARPVEVIDGKLPQAVRSDNSCADLRYLGTGSQRVVLYDTRRGQVVSVPGGDVTLAFPKSCQD